MAMLEDAGSENAGLSAKLKLDEVTDDDNWGDLLLARPRGSITPGIDAKHRRLGTIRQYVRVESSQIESRDSRPRGLPATTLAIALVDFTNTGEFTGVAKFGEAGNHWCEVCTGTFEGYGRRVGRSLVGGCVPGPEASRWPQATGSWSIPGQRLRVEGLERPRAPRATWLQAAASGKAGQCILQEKTVPRKAAEY
ncbi:hypothetical protein G7Y89_g4907 [Cudoniella acicularis]|uniref:Uncharacterized protein n=1 Tax=Cudoniella acicularis TaxID=354080 RepID=A0A8H4RQP5_9HELO|nr:hypothetical protein G7Y89_g4907 [Cudoniella acicularis]